MYCKKCGNGVELNASFCPKCGAKLPEIISFSGDSKQIKVGCLAQLVYAIVLFVFICVALAIVALALPWMILIGFAIIGLTMFIFFFS